MSIDWDINRTFYWLHNSSKFEILTFSSLPTKMFTDDSKNCIYTSWLHHFPLLRTFRDYWILSRAGITQSVQRIATDWTVRRSNPSGGEIFRTCPDRPCGPPSLPYNGYRVSFPGVKRPGRGVDHPPHLAPRLKKEQSYTSTPLLGLRSLF